MRWFSLSPEAGEEGVGELAGLHDHRAFKRFRLFPSLPMGERVRVKGEVIFTASAIRRRIDGLFCSG
jgi:hypothetical protein